MKDKKNQDKKSLNTEQSFCKHLFSIVAFLIFQMKSKLILRKVHLDHSWLHCQYSFTVLLLSDLAFVGSN